MQQKRTVVQVDGLDLAFTQQGQGSPVVYIHGAVTTLEEGLIGLGDEAGSRYQLTSFDRPGHGTSGSDNYAWNTNGFGTNAAINYLGNTWALGTTPVFLDFHQDDTGDGYWSANLTNMVPESASWAMLIAGFGLTGAAMRRRPSVTSVAA